MPTNFHQKLIDLLKSDDRFRDEDGELITAAIRRSAGQLDHDLLIGLPFYNNEDENEFREVLESVLSLGDST